MSDLFTPANMASKQVNLQAPPASFRSKIWEHFGFKTSTEGGVKTPVKGTTTCKHCYADVSYKTGNTSNMATHMKRHHPDVDVSGCIRKPKQQPQAATSEASGQLRLQEAFKNKLPVRSVRALAITKSIGQFIALDMRPYSIVDSAGFHNMIKTLEPKYELPSRTHFAQTVIPELYKETVTKVLNDIDSAQHVSLTTDGWTSRATQSYITVTAHYINDQWEMKSATLQTRPLFESHTAANLADVLQKSVVEWHVAKSYKINSDHSDDPTQVRPIPITTDNASNIVKGVQEGGFKPHIRCFAHSLNLAAQKGLETPSIARLLGRMRRVVTFFHSSSTATKLLESKQKALGLPIHKLIQDVKTRWNSSYDMASRYLEQQPAIYATLLSKDIKKNAKDIITLSDSDVKLAEELVNVLKPLKTVTTIMCDEHAPTVSVIHPMREMLMRAFADKDSDSHAIQDVKSAVLKDIRSRYTDEDVVHFLELSCALDPRFRSLPYHDDEDRTRIFNDITGLIMASDKQVNNNNNLLKFAWFQLSLFHVLF